MKKLLPSLVAAFLFSAIIPLHATLIVYGIISGVVTSVSNPLNDLRTTVGMTVSGTFSYDYDLLSAPDSSGDRTDSFGDPNASFSIQSSVGDHGGASSDLLTLTVDVNGLPVSGAGVSEPDLSMGPSYVGLNYGSINNIPIGWNASVTYTITSFNPVSDTGTTWFLLGIGLAGVTVARHFFRQIRV